ncbi:MAG: c-type cytochrome [Gemmobacter sp.]
MKTTRLALAAVFALGAAPAIAADAEAGAKAFNQCQTCHVVVNPAGETLAGRNAKTGPNLYGVVGRQAGTVEGFKYGDDLVAAGAKGLVWDEATFVAYVQDPSKFLKEYLGDSGAKGKMTFKVKKEADAANLYAFLSSLARATN